MKAIEGFKVIGVSAPSAVITKLVGVLAQLLMSEDEKELAAVNEALIAALEKDVQATTTALLDQMNSEEGIRSKAVAFMLKELCPRANALLNKSEEAQAAVAEQIKKVLANVNAKEFNMCMRILFSLKMFKNGAEGATELLDIVHKTMDLSSEFQPAGDAVDKVILTMASARLLFQHGAPPNKLISFISKQVHADPICMSWCLTASVACCSHLWYAHATWSILFVTRIWTCLS
jgi:hypothetical protein